MDDTFSPKTDQRAGVRPISFILEDIWSTGAPVTLPIRPEDLSRTEPARVTINQTLGRETQGWVDHFGEGLPSVTISGHTGWNYKPGLGKDGFQSFESLNDLIVHKYPAAKQRAFDAGLNPARVKLLFIDLLDNFGWSVVPTQFVLRRSKSRPLLFQYNMTLQAVSTSVDGGLDQYRPPPRDNVKAGKSALDLAIEDIEGLIAKAKAGLFSALRNIANSVLKFVNFAVSFLRRVQGIIAGVNGLISGAAGFVIGIAKSIAMVGREVFRTFSAIMSIGTTIKSAFSEMGAAFNEVVCIFSNALRPRMIYQNYDGLYGASNCSSTTGGRMPSAFSNQNVFALLNPNSDSPVKLSGAAIQSMNVVSSSDPVLSPLPPAEISRHLDNIVDGTTVVYA